MKMKQIKYLKKDELIAYYVHNVEDNMELIHLSAEALSSSSNSRAYSRKQLIEMVCENCEGNLTPETKVE